MNETIGSKGGHNDYRRVMTITRRQKEKLQKYQEEQELKELEKEVKKKQRYTLIKTMPIVILGQAFIELTKPKNKELKEEKFIVEDKEEPKTKKVVIVLEDGTKQVIEVPIHIEIKEEKIEVKTEPVKEEKQEYIPIKEEKKEEKTKSDDFTDLTENQRIKLQKLQARKIIDVYEKQLKDIRYELRNLIIEYNTLLSEEDRILKAKEEEKILDRLNEIIKKIEELKEKLRIEDLDKYDDNYIYTLIEGYLEDFKDKRIIKEIKDSPLYILISEKLDEFDKKKDTFKSKVEDKKDALEKDEEKLEELKEKYASIEKISKDLDSFYREQEKLLIEMQDKIDKAVTVTERVETRVEFMNRQTTALLRRLSLIMLIPGRKGIKAFATMAAIYAGMARNMIKPTTITKKYKDVMVEDYSSDIIKSIDSIDTITRDINKSSREIDSIISKINEEFSDYIGVMPECDKLLSNLNKVKDNLREKEYELEKIKEKQEKELEINNSKVLSKGTYPM